MGQRQGDIPYCSYLPWSVSEEYETPTKMKATMKMTPTKTNDTKKMKKEEEGTTV